MIWKYKMYCASVNYQVTRSWIAKERDEAEDEDETEAEAEEDEEKDKDEEAPPYCGSCRPRDDISYFINKVKLIS
jgi:hypothetical protein